MTTKPLRIPKCITAAEAQSFAQLQTDNDSILERFAERSDAVGARYGHEQILTREADWIAEAIDEAIDGIVYCTAEMEKLRSGYEYMESYAFKCTSVARANFLAALVNLEKAGSLPGKTSPTDVP